MTEEQEPAERRPTGQALEVEKLSPELEKILQTWEEKTSEIKKLKGEFFKHTYDNTFNVQSVSKGAFMYEAPDKGYYMFEGLAQLPPDSRLRLDKNRKPYEFQPENDEKWYCTGNEIYQINVGQKTYDKVPIPEESRGKNIIDGPLPFLFGMKAEQAKRRYHLALDEASNDKQIIIVVKPKLQQDMANYSEAKVMLDPVTFLPRAVRLVDSGGTKETVHRFHKVTTRIIDWPFQNPFQPSLLGYKPVVREQGVSEDSETIRRPVNGNSPRRGAVRPRTAVREDDSFGMP